MKKDIRILAASLPHFLRMLTGKLGLKVQWKRGTVTAKTNLTTVVFEPFYLTDDKSTDSLETIVSLYYGKAWHEGGHHRHTDMVASAKWRGENQKIESYYMPIEDARMEAALVKEFPGARIDLNSAFETLTEKGLFGPIDDTTPKAHLLKWYVGYRLRDILRYQDQCRRWADAGEPHLIAAYGDPFVTRLNALLQTQGRAMKTSMDSCLLVEQIIVIAEEEAENQMQPDPQQQDPAKDDSQSESDADDEADSQAGTAGDDAEQDSGDEPDSGDDEGAGADANGQSGEDDAADEEAKADSTANADDDADANDDANSDAGDGADANTQGDSDADANADEDAQERQARAKNLRDAMEDTDEVADVDAALAEAIAEVLQDEHDDSENDSSDLIADDLVDEQCEADMFTNTSVVRRQQDFNEAALTSMRLANTIRVTLESKLRSPSLPMEKGRFDPRRIPRIPMGDTRLFRKQHEKKALNTAIFLLLDTSGSMQGERNTLSCDALYATVKALAPLQGVSVAAAGFPAGGVIHRFDQKFIHEPEAFGVQAPGCSTPLAEALAGARAMINRRPEKRKIIVVLTDGEPDNARSAINQRMICEHYGIEMYALGIQHAAVKNIFPQWRVINTLSDLTPELLGLLGQQLYQQVA